MITRRILANLITFLALAVVLVIFGVVNLLGNPLRSRTHISAVFPDASGLHRGFDVTLNGVEVGSVEGVSLTGNGVRVGISIDPGVKVPGDVQASVDLANALGEQQIDLIPRHGGTAPALRDGAMVPVDPKGIPASVGRLVDVATRLLDAIPPGDLNQVLHEMAVALRGRGQDLRTITDSSTAFAQEFLRYQDQFRQLLANSPPVLNAVAAVGPQLRSALANTAVLVQVLANRRQDLSNFLLSGSVAASDLNRLLSAELPNLACLTHDFADLTVNLAQPANLSDLNTTLLTNRYFFGAVDGVSPAGPAASLYPGDPARAQQYWLRTRLLFPPAQPAASSYTRPKNMPATKPGAACRTEFGPGVGPATQTTPAPSPPGPGGQLVPPPASASTVRGGPPDPAGEPAAYRMPGGPLLLGTLLTAAALLLSTLRAPLDPSDRGRRGRTRRRRSGLAGHSHGRARGRNR